MRTEFANSGRIAGSGVLYDDYGDESGGKQYENTSHRVVFPSDGLTQQEIEALNGEVKTFKAKKQ